MDFAEWLIAAVIVAIGIYFLLVIVMLPPGDPRDLDDPDD
jgi:hypothetical protein